MVLQVVLAAMLCLRPGASGACSCVCGTPRQTLRASQAVFVGTVLALRVESDTLRPPLARDGAPAVVRVTTARLEVESAFKGPRTGVLEVTAFGDNDDGDLCGLRFAVGETYLIYASPLPGGRVDRLYAGACGVCGSGPLARRAKAAVELRAASAAGDTVSSARLGRGATRDLT